MGAKVLYDDGAHKFLWIRWGGDEEGELVQTNQFLIIDGDEAMLLDPGGETKVGRSKVRFIPAHFLHSTGNFNLFDETSRILFSGDIGASVYPPGQMPLEVKDFDEHVKHMEGFHRRYKASKKACRLWVKRVMELKPKMIVPQHGSIFTGENVDKFLSWLENLDCGVDILEKL